MQTPGTYISGIGHVGLIGWLIFGWGFQSEPLDFDTMDVSVISGEEFEQMRAASTPEPGEAEPTAPAQPVIDETPPPLPDAETPAEQAQAPEPVDPPDAETPPPTPPETPPVADVTDAPPVVPVPPETAPPTPDLEISENPTPQQADRVAAVPTPLAPPDATIDDLPREQLVPDDSENAEVEQDPQEAAALEETTTEIVTEAEEPSSAEDTVATVAPQTSMRPLVRPERPVSPEPQPEEPEQTETARTIEPDSDDSDVSVAIAEALASTDAAEAPALPLGSQLNRIEIGNVTSAIGRRWVIDPGARSSQVIVTVRFSLTPDGRIDGDVDLVQVTDAPRQVQDAAFRSARSALWAVSRGGGFPFPAEKYAQWKDVVADFDPSGVRLR